MNRFAATLWIFYLVLPLWAAPPEALALADAQRLPPDVQCRVRYLDLGAVPLGGRDGFRKSLAFLVNSVSRAPDIVQPTPVAPTLLRVNLDDYGWKAATWDKLEDIDPYYHVDVVEHWPGGYDRRVGRHFAVGDYTIRAAAPWLDARAISGLIRVTQTRVPLVRADWWFVQAMRQLSLGNKQTGAGYYDWLGLKSRRDYERLVHLNERDSLDIGREIRAAVEKSGVAAQNRQVVRLQALTGGAWVTLDTDDSTGQGNAVRNLKRGEFLHKAEEHYGVLPNGLFAFFLSDAGGKRQDSAPDFIGPDDSTLRTGRDARIHVGLSCVRCHVEGLRDVDDWVRRQSKVASSPDYQALLDLRRQYFSDLKRQLNRDRLLYTETLFETNGLSPAANAKLVGETWNRYVETPVGPKEAAFELGVTEAVLRQRLAAYKASPANLPDPLLEGLTATPPVALTRQHAEESWGILATIVLAGGRK